MMFTALPVDQEPVAALSTKNPFESLSIRRPSAEILTGHLWGAMTHSDRRPEASNHAPSAIEQVGNIGHFCMRFLDLMNYGHKAYVVSFEGNSPKGLKLGEQEIDTIRGKDVLNVAGKQIGELMHSFEPGMDREAKHNLLIFVPVWLQPKKAR